ncbi:hypothetical protein WJX72_002075 [[Myrmecia] bisecta]|uniref:EF-hand domain-containing protein n=1 Tax=[Myrmecia] bisecta TaxID=41462 RepID=A0AAW1R5U0_9CHLO
MPRVASSVKFGDEKRKGTEKSWRTEYRSQFSRGEHTDPEDQIHPAFRVRSPSKGRTLEQVLSDKLTQQKWGPQLVRKAFRELDRNNDGVICPDEFNSFLHTYNIFLDPAELQQLISKYAHNEKEGVNYADFLHMVSPEDFPRDGQTPAPPEPERMDAWAHWNVYRLSERGRVKF